MMRLRKLKNILKKLFYRIWAVKYWAIAYRKSEQSLYQDNEMINCFEIFEDNDYVTMADPFLFTYEGQTWIFYEKKGLNEKRGTIWAKNLDDEKAEAVLILEEAFHLSYPYIFSQNGSLYMIPETMEAKEIRLYQCIKFPNQWEYKKTILNVEGLDTNLLFIQSDMCYMYTYVDRHLLIYRLYLARKKEFELEKIELVYKSEENLTLRGAGNIIKSESGLLRPSQNCCERYGGGLLFYELNVSSGMNIFINRKKITPTMIKIKDMDYKWKKICGVHTYNNEKNYEVIDVLVMKLHWTVPFRKIYWYCKKKWGKIL